jgi:hypothetical protein
MNTRALCLIILTAASSSAVTAVKPVKMLGEINGEDNVHATYAEAVVIEAINGQSTVDITSTGGSIRVLHNIDGRSNVTLTAAAGISIGEEINGRSHVTLSSSGGDISIGEEIDGHSHVCAKTTGKVRVGGELGGHSTLIWSGSEIEGPSVVWGFSSLSHAAC